MCKNKCVLFKATKPRVICDVAAQNSYINQTGILLTYFNEYWPMVSNSLWSFISMLLLSQIWPVWTPTVGFLCRFDMGPSFFDDLLLSVTMLLLLCRHPPSHTEVLIYCPEFYCFFPTLPSPATMDILFTLLEMWSSSQAAYILPLSWCLLCPSWTQESPCQLILPCRCSFQAAKLLTCCAR